MYLLMGYEETETIKKNENDSIVQFNINFKL